MKWIYHYLIRPIVRWFKYQFKKYEAYSYHLEDGKQYHVLEDDGKYTIVSRNSLKHHNKIAKKSTTFKHLTMKEINELALYSTPLKKKTQR